MSRKSETEFGLPVWVDYLIAVLLVLFLAVYSYGLFFQSPLKSPQHDLQEGE